MTSEKQPMEDDELAKHQKETDAVMKIINEFGNRLEEISNELQKLNECINNLDDDVEEENETMKSHL